MQCLVGLLRENKGLYCCFHPHSAEALLDSDSLDFIFCKQRGKEKAKLVTLGNFRKST